MDVALSAWVPFDQAMRARFHFLGHAESEQYGPIDAQICYVTSGYARAMGMPLIKGRMISDEDTVSSGLVAVINEAFAKLFPPGQDPIGKHIVGVAKKTFTIVGVLGDARQHDLTHTPDPEAILAYQQVSTTEGSYFLVASGTKLGGFPKR